MNVAIQSPFLDDLPGKSIEVPSKVPSNSQNPNINPSPETNTSRTYIISTPAMNHLSLNLSTNLSPTFLQAFRFVSTCHERHSPVPTRCVSVVVSFSAARAMWFCRKSQNIPAVIRIANTQETQRTTVAAEILRPRRTRTPTDGDGLGISWGCCGG